MQTLPVEGHNVAYHIV